MDLTFCETIAVEEYALLRRAVGWTTLVNEQAQQGLDNSACIVSCYDGDRIVGAARMIWDGGYIAYLADVMVLPAYQGREIGSRMVERAIAHMRAQLRAGWRIKIVLVASKGMEDFYTRFGFKARPNEREGAGMDMWLEG